MTRRPLLVPFALLFALVPVLAAADGGPSEARDALRAAEGVLRDRDFARAADALRGVRAKFPTSPEALEASVLEARALLLAGRAREALDRASEFLAAHADSEWAGRMKATLADAYAALKAPADEAKVLRERAELLTGDAYRGKVAALYVALGDGDFDGRDGKDDLGRPVKKKDFAAARAAYGKAVEVGVAEADRLRVRARIALCAEETGDFAGAAAAWDALVTEAPAGPGADPEAWLVGRGRARLRAGDRAKARADLREAQGKFAQGKKGLEVLRLLAEERFAAGREAGDEQAAGLAFEEGFAFLRQAVAEHREAAESKAAQRQLAETLLEVGRPEQAAAEWRGLLERLPKDEDAPAWRFALAEALGAAGKHDEAVVEWKGFLSAYPNHPLWQQVQERIPATRFQKGEAFAAQGDADAAVAAWRSFAEEFPTHALAPVALTRAGGLLRDRKDFEGAIATWRGVTGRYAGDAQAPVAWLAVATTLEDDLARLDDAVKEYEELLKKHPGVAEAASRLQRLKSKHLEVRGERVVGSAEPAVLKVVTRNLPTLKVKVYKLGLEDYFRRKQTVSGIESIQVEIVKPDATAEWKVDPYAPFALLSAERPVPTTGPGAYVVVAGDDDLTATTLLLVSDVETVVKAAAGRQVFVWARDRATGAPVEGARVLVSDGSKVFAEGATGKDGVYLLDTDKTAARVFVVKDGHAAATEWQPGPVFAEGWQSKAHVATDRPVYRPGQAVSFRAVYRRADGGGYAVPAGVKGRAVLVDPRGTEVERTDVVASDAGTFTGTFALDGEAPLGDWTVRLEVDDRTFGGRFRVLEYRKPEFTVSVVPARPSYRTGDEAKATVRLAYTFGGPVVGAPVQWTVVRVPRDFTPSAVDDYSWYFQDPDALERARKAARTAPQGTLVARGEAKTDDRGETTVTFATQERDEDAEYVVSASAVDVTRRFVVDEGRIPVVRRDHWAVVRTDRRVYRPKQEVRATFTTVDANQSPVAKAGDAVLVRVKRTPLPPRKGQVPPAGQGDASRRPAPPVRLGEEEIEVAKVPVSTDEKGRAEVRLVAPGAGTYRVRWTSRDARGAVVTAWAGLDVAGEAEDLSKDARLVASKETYVEGDRAEVLLQSPVTKVKALLTFEGEKVLGYRLVDVDATSTMLDVPVEGAWAPNVVMKVAIPAKDKLLEAEDEIVVFRYLAVTVTPSRREAGPGEEVGFEVTTADASGKPVAADVGLSVADEALFAIAPDQAPAIRPFFYDRKRVNRVVTSSSVGWRTYGTTRETNKDLLADAAARSGDPGVVFAQSALRLAREAMQRGDLETAVAQALAAAAADASSWDARNLVAELRSRPEAQEALSKFDENRLDELRRAVEEAKSADKAPSAPRLRRAAGAPPPGAAPAPAPKPSGPYAEKSRMNFDRDAKLKDHNETADAEDAQLEGGLVAGDAPAEDARKGESLGTGGGAGGAYGGRAGGKKTLTARGGGRGGGAGGQFRGPGGAVPPGLREPGDPAAPQADAYSRFKSQSAVTQELAQQLDANGFVGYLEKQSQFGLGLDAGNAPEPTLRKTFADTAAFLPSVRTDASGKATVTVKLPDNLTTWRATARGVAGASLVGEAKASVVARKDLLLRVDVPRFLVQGDRATVPAVVHNATDAEASVSLRAKTTGATLSGEDGTVVVPAHGRAMRDRDVSVDAAGAVRLEAEAVSAAGGGDRVEAAFGALPRGVRVVDGRSGVVSTAAGDVQETFLEVPQGAVAGATRLTVVLHPGVEAAVLDALQFLEVFPYGCVEQTVHRVLPAAWALRALTAVGSPDAKRIGDLRAALRLSVARLRNLAAQDGSFGWWRGGKADASMTALALLGLVEAAKADVPDAQAQVERTAAALVRVLRAAPDDVQALGHYALAACGRADEEAYQVTFRRRAEELSAAGLAWMTLAAVARDREFDADECSRLLLARRTDGADGTTRWAGRKDDCLVGSERLATALAVRALVSVGSADAAVERAMTWLLAHRPEGGFGTTMEAAAFVGACAAWLEKARPSRFGGTVTVLADGTAVRTVEVAAGAGIAAADRRFSVDVSSWVPGRHTLALRLSGQGELRWAARLEAVVATPELSAEEHGLAVERLYLDPELPPVEGAELPPKPGHEILRPSARPKVEPKSRTTAVSGDRVLVRLLLRTSRDLRFVMLEDPLPAGFEVLDETATGPFDGQERRDDRQVFFLSDVKAGATVVTYVLQAVHPGRYTALPARASAMYLPEVHGRSAGDAFTVSATRSAGDGETQPTPDEFYAAARALLAKKAWPEASKAFAALKALPLRDEVVVEVEAALLRCALETKDAAEIVRAREELVRRDPSRVPSDLATARAVAAAYADVGAHGVASALFRDLVARAFGVEVEWTRTLVARGRALDGLVAATAALRGYPVSNATAAVALEAASRWKDLPRPEGGPRKAGAPMDAESIDALRDVAAHYVETGVAAPASYALVEALRRTRALDDAVAEADAFPRRFPDSPFVDDTLFFLMDSRLLKFEASPTDATAAPVLDAARRLTTEEFRRDGGARGPSEFRPRAWHATARVRHVLGDLTGAIAAYREAAPQVEDAREALAWLTEARLDVVESVTAGVAGSASFPLRHRNVAEVRLRAYPVDLQVLFAMRRTLEGLNRIDLSGIAPALEWTVATGGADDHAWHTTDVALPLGKDAAGVFLVVAKAGTLETSTIVLKTDLQVAIQPVGDKVRVHVSDTAGKGVRGAFVTVSDGKTIKARGLTDGRGVFEAPGVGSTPFVVVNAGDRYAVAR